MWVSDFVRRADTIVTGHSVGGAIAQALTSNLIREGDPCVQRNLRCVTFGAPCSTRGSPTFRHLPNVVNFSRVPDTTPQRLQAVLQQTWPLWVCNHSVLPTLCAADSVTVVAGNQPHA